MKIKLKLTLLLVVLFTNLAIGQRDKMVLTYKDGSQVNGYGKLISEKKIKFKKSRKAKPQKLDYGGLKDVESIKYYGNDEITTYVFVEIKDNKIKLLERTVKGDITLYKRIRITGGTYMPMGGGAMGGAPGIWTGPSVYKNYYVQRKGEAIATHLGSNQLFTKNFKKSMSEYVKDCPELVKKIETREFRKRNLVEIVEFYNDNCSD